MSAAAIIEQLDVLIKLHEHLNTLAVQKTEVIKKGDMERINKLLNEEQKYVKAIQQVENKRQQYVQDFFKQGRTLQLAPNLLDVIEAAPQPEKETLTKQRSQLLQIVEELKNHNSLNQQLIYHSLQYVNVSLDLLRPQQTNLNYSKTNTGNQRQASRGMFDSKA
ncbi:MAG: flagellar protein FlgN [Bacillus sp. (in: firmicutes)]